MGSGSAAPSAIGAPGGPITEVTAGAAGESPGGPLAALVAAPSLLISAPDHSGD